MKKSVVIPFMFAFVIIFGFSLVSSVACDLDISMINQDPYPATPGDYVKVVFQIDGVENPECGLVSFEVKENYPFSLDPGTTNKVTVNSGTYSRTFSSFYLATYKLRVDNNALNGDNPIEVVYGSNGAANLLKEFDIYVEDTKADFEVYVKDYNYATKELTFEILNIEEADVEALTIEIPKQEGVNIKGANRVVVGDLDSNEYTTADFEATFPEGETKILLDILYTDSINVRRTLQKEVTFDSIYFEGRGEKKGGTIWIILILAGVGWFFWRRHKKHQMKKKMMHSGNIVESFMSKGKKK